MLLQLPTSSGLVLGFRVALTSNTSVVEILFVGLHLGKQVGDVHGGA